LRVDGVFGLQTRDAVRQFQTQKHLQADGVVGEQTWRALGVTGPSPAFRPRGVSEPGMSEVQAIAAPWMAIAVAELGIHRDVVHHQNQRIIGYLRTTTLNERMANTDSTAWCSAFVNWVLIKAGKQGTNNALAASWLSWSGGTSIPPKFGAITVIRKNGATSDKHTGSTTGNHVGFCVAIDAGSVRLLGGNQGSSVSYATFSLARWQIRGAIWPS
jgi:uncharacterized protein (TIGR02594 family)